MFSAGSGSPEVNGMTSSIRRGSSRRCVGNGRSAPITLPPWADGFGVFSGGGAEKGWGASDVVEGDSNWASFTAVPSRWSASNPTGDSCRTPPVMTSTAASDRFSLGDGWPGSGDRSGLPVVQPGRPRSRHAASRSPCRNHSLNSMTPPSEAWFNSRGLQTG